MTNIIPFSTKTIQIFRKRPKYLNLYLRVIKYIGLTEAGEQQRQANNESSKVFDIIKPGRRVKLKGYRQYRVNNL